MKIIPETREEQHMLERNEPIVNALRAVHEKELKNSDCIPFSVYSYSDAALEVTIWGQEDIGANLKGRAKVLWETLSFDQIAAVVACVKDQSPFEMLVEYGNEALAQTAETTMLEALGLSSIDKAIAIARPVGETTLNGIEFLLDEEGEIKCFASRESATLYLVSHGHSSTEAEDDFLMNTLEEFGEGSQDA